MGQRTLILAVGFHGLRRLLQEVAPEYAHLADVERITTGFEEAVVAVQQWQAQRRVDAVVAAGSHAAYLRDRLDVPVVSVRVDGYDVMRALAQARAVTESVALLVFDQVPPELQQFLQAFAPGVPVHHYRSANEARQVVATLAASGVQGIVAPGLATDLARQAGLHGEFLYSPEAVRRAFDDALALVAAAHAESARRQRLDAILGELREGVMAVDRHGRIETLNELMAQWLGQTRSHWVGRALSEVAPELAQAFEANPVGQREGETIVPLQGRDLVIQCRPLQEGGTPSGHLLIAQEPATIRQSERRLRGRGRPQPVGARYGLHDFLGVSRAARHAVTLAERYAATDSTTLILGESGTGKEILAQGMHQASARAAGPFVAINCGALPETLLESELFGYEEGAFTGARKGGKPGLFEHAHTGTLFLDEVAEVSPALQARLLRVLQEREVQRVGGAEAIPVDVRILAATHTDLAARVRDGSFRLDLYYRLHILVLRAPPLRERPDDLPGLAKYLVARVARRLDREPMAAQTAVTALLAATRAQAYPWPGNVRELENFIERLVIAAECFDGSGQVALAEVIPEVFGDAPAVTSDGPARDEAGSWIAPGELLHGQRPQALARATVRSMGEVQSRQQRALLALRNSHGNRAAAAQTLGVSRTTLWRWLRG